MLKTFAVISIIYSIFPIEDKFEYNTIKASSSIETCEANRKYIIERIKIDLREASLNVEEIKYHCEER